ncbi:DNA alkylation repair protein [Runella sp.]|uniref:DNA alkylation repair protein n=1 Tax=Runella sp. TaxID=1960881 RepID=UPI003D0F171F
MSALKDIYSSAFYQKFAGTLTKTLPAFDTQRFMELIFDEDFDRKELKDRMRHTTRVLHHFLPVEFSEAAKLIEKIIEELRKENSREDSLAYIFFPDYIETYGLEDYEHSVKAIEFVTQFVSCEFAVRPFLLKYGDAMMEQMMKWSRHENHKVRRLASEGSRPRLPWAMAIPALKKDPASCLLLLENLKNDPSEWVRRSVANHLNDISKDHPEMVLKVANTWKGHTKETDAIVKHACRTLLKQGHRDVLTLYNLVSEHIRLENFTIQTPKITIGESLEFTLSVINENEEHHTVRLEYAVYYQKQNGQLSKKVFKISEREYAPGEKAVILRKQKFVPITTRKFYAGAHRLSVIINGEEKQVGDFELIV